MLFNSPIFLFMYLPVTLLGFFLIGRFSQAWGAAWLAAASLFFYGWWNPVYLSLLLMSALFNYTLGMAISKAAISQQNARKKSLLIFAIIVNLSLLCYFKYANFFLDSANTLAGTHWTLANIVLPLGISFFTFTQITFLVDTYKSVAKEYNPVHYLLFVTWFPHLIAGPILHHKEMMPQFARPETYHIHAENVAVGLTIFFFGLFKKVILADSISAFATPVFTAAGHGAELTFFQAWGGALSYTLQLYFDFSGYSDMAIGLSLLFGVKLPLNFNSPYKSVNIIEFWRCWHMTLSRFLRDYLYIPLGGNRKGLLRRYANLIVTMLLGGLWHGAGWTYVMWGGLHGLYLVINHAWHALRGKLGHDLSSSSRLGRLVAGLITFLAVVVAWVFFRADNFGAALIMLKAMTGMAGISALEIPQQWMPNIGWFWQLLAGLGVVFKPSGPPDAGMEIILIIILLGIVWLMPNTQQVMAHFKPTLDFKSYSEAKVPGWLTWQPTMKWAHVTGAIAFLSLLYMLSGHRTSEFLYFQF